MIRFCFSGEAIGCTVSHQKALSKASLTKKLEKIPMASTVEVCFDPEVCREILTTYFWQHDLWFEVAKGTFFFVRSSMMAFANMNDSTVGSFQEHFRSPWHWGVNVEFLFQPKLLSPKTASWGVKLPPPEATRYAYMTLKGPSWLWFRRRIDTNSEPKYTVLVGPLFEVQEFWAI